MARRLLARVEEDIADLDIEIASMSHAHGVINAVKKTSIRKKLKKLQAEFVSPEENAKDARKERAR